MHLETGVPQGWLLCGVRSTCCELTSLHVQIFILPWLRSLYLGAGFQAASHIIMWFSSVQSLSRVRLFATPWTAAYQASLSITNSWSLLKLSDAIQPSHPLSSPSPPTFNLSQHQGLPMRQFFASGGQSIGISASASVVPMNIQD